MHTIVAAYLDPIEAQLALGLLQAEGIRARLDDSGTAIANWEWRLAIGGMRLRVPEAQAAHARRVLAALDAGEYALDEEIVSREDREGQDHGARGVGGMDAAGGTLREPGALLAPDRESFSSRVAWAALMLFGLPLPWRRARGDDRAAVRRA